MTGTRSTRRRAGLALFAAVLIIATSLLTVLSQVGGTEDRVAQVSSLSITRGETVSPSTPRNVEWRTRLDLGRLQPDEAGVTDHPGRVDIVVALTPPGEHGRDLSRTRAPPAV